MTSQTSGSKIEWYLARDGRQHGPLGDIEMTKFLELGHLRPGDLVWQAGFAEWKPAVDVFDLDEKTLISRRKADPVPQPAVPTPAATEVKPTDPTPVAASVSSPAAAGATESDAVDTKTGIGTKKPLETPLLIPLLAPTQLLQPTADGKSGVNTPGSYGSEIPQSVTSLNERLQRAATERSAAAPAAPTQPVYKNWPQTELPQPDPQPTGSAGKRVDPKGAVSSALPQPGPHQSGPALSGPAQSGPAQSGPAQSGPAKLQPLRELRPVAPVPLMPLEPRTVAAAPVTAGPADAGNAQPKRKKDPKPQRPALAAPDQVRGRARLLGIGLTLAIIVGGGGWLTYGWRDALKSTIGVATQTTSTVPNQSAAVTASASTTAPATANAGSATTSAEPSGKSAPFVTSAKTAEMIDADLKRSAVWQLISREFPEWHRDRVAELAKLAAEKRDATAISTHIAESIVSLRRKFADQSLSASPEQLRAVAVAFLENLRQLSAQSTDACYGFISQGETYPAVIDLMRQGDRTDALHKQVIAVFEAVAAGRKSPQTTVPPRKSDYDVLAGELTARGWSQSDLQMFSDAKALATAPPGQVCKMVQDWFAAQITIKDPAIQQRLLIESLRPVVAG